ncbi:MAG: hypothetical protein JNJ40_06245 [Bacteroidia bacterium]|nr:hypothetical protein [Bacteroidia bacterium]
MKKVLIMALMAIVTTNSYAQLGNIKNRLKTKVEDKVVEKAENKIDKTADDITSENNKTKKTETKKQTSSDANSEVTTNTSNSDVKRNDSNSEQTSNKPSNNMAQAESTTKQSSAKFIFADKPITNESINDQKDITFTSKNFIYGRIELPETVANFFKIPQQNGKYTNFINYEVRIFKDDDEMGSANPIWNWCYITNSDFSKTHFNFDILPEPSKASTVISPLEDFSAGKSSAPLYNSIDPMHFPKSDKYKVKLTFYRKTVNGYGELKPKEEWPICEGEFVFDFNEDDIATLQTNGKNASDLVKDNFQNKAREEADLPKSWNMQSSAIGSGYTEQQIKGMIAARYQGSKLNKLVIEPQKGGWVVEKNDLGIPKDKYFDQIISIFITDSNKKCFYIEGYVYQTYEGGGKYGNVWIYPEKEIQISCDKMK